MNAVLERVPKSVPRVFLGSGVSGSTRPDFRKTRILVRAKCLIDLMSLLQWQHDLFSVS